LARFVLRTAIGLALVAFLLLRADLGAVSNALRQADVTLLILGTVAFFASLLLSSLRWRAFLRPLGIDLHIVHLIRLYLMGTFFNAFLPTGFGGDAYKSFVMDRGTAAIEVPLAAAVLDRLAGLAGLALLALMGTVVQIRAGADTEAAWIAAGAAAALLAGGLLVLLAARNARGPVSITPGLRSRIRTFVDSVGIGARRPDAIRLGALWGVITSVLLVAAHDLLLAAVHPRIPAAQMAGIVLLAALTTVIPLSINGLGFREATYVWALGASGVSHDTALVFALLVLGVTLLSSAVGGVVYAVVGGRLSRRVQDVQDSRNDQQVDADQ
jgi:uncharacterized protein (TIRG00374 family)